MKKLFTMIAVVAFSTAMFGQTMFHVGGNLSKWGGSDIDGTKYTPGYQVGFSSDFGEFFSIEPGIFLIHKGTAYENSDDAKYHLNYLQVPVNAKLNFEIGDLRLMVGAGIYGSVGLWGNYKYKDMDNKAQKDKIEWFDEKKSDIQPFDFGAQVFAGIMVGRFGVSLGYQPGLMSIARKPEQGDKGDLKNGSLYLNLTFALTDTRYRSSR